MKGNQRLLANGRLNPWGAFLNTTPIHSIIKLRIGVDQEGTNSISWQSIISFSIFLSGIFLGIFCDLRLCDWKVRQATNLWGYVQVLNDWNYEMWCLTSHLKSRGRLDPRYAFIKVYLYTVYGVMRDKHLKKMGRFDPRYALSIYMVCVVMRNTFEIQGAFWQHVLYDYNNCSIRFPIYMYLYKYFYRFTAAIDMQSYSFTCDHRIYDLSSDGGTQLLLVPTRTT
jgi:hypothetical protein